MSHPPSPNWVTCHTSTNTFSCWRAYPVRAPNWWCWFYSDCKDTTLSSTYVCRRATTASCRIRSRFEKEFFNFYSRLDVNWDLANKLNKYFFFYDILWKFVWCRNLLTSQIIRYTLDSTGVVGGRNYEYHQTRSYSLNFRWGCKVPKFLGIWATRTYFYIFGEGSSGSTNLAKVYFSKNYREREREKRERGERIYIYILKDNKVPYWNNTILFW